MRLRFILCLSALNLMAQSGVDPAALLRRARLTIEENYDRMQRYTCQQTMEREFYVPRHKTRANESCEEAIAGLGAGKSQKVSLASKDRLRLDLIVAGHGESHTWPSGGDIDEAARRVLTKGLLGTGDFSSFTASIFLTGEATTKFERQTEVDGASAVEYSYEVPADRSHYRVNGRNYTGMIAYSGSFWLDAATARVLRLSVNVNHFPESMGLCRATTVIDLETRVIHEQPVLVPHSTELRSLHDDGAEGVNRVQYSACREFTAESNLRFDLDDPAVRAAETPVVLPAGVEIDLQLLAAIDGTRAWGGDAIQAKVLHGAPGLPAGSTVHGRLLRVEHDLAREGWWIALRFDEAVADGRKMAVRLRPGRLPLTHFESVRPSSLPELPGGGMIWFPSRPPTGGRGVRTLASSGQPVLPRGWISRWVTF